MKHEHSHDHSHTNGPISAEETLALLKYMVQHNAHHAEELHETAHALPEDSAKLIHEAVDLLNMSNEKIRQAIERMG